MKAVVRCAIIDTRTQAALRSNDEQMVAFALRDISNVLARTESVTPRTRPSSARSTHAIASAPPTIGFAAAMQIVQQLGWQRWFVDVWLRVS
jgi:hypothetical protein